MGFFSARMSLKKPLNETTAVRHSALRQKRRVFMGLDLLDSTRTNLGSGEQRASRSVPPRA
jgi:hypothetical protein